ncbi:hypothetical protein PTSG_02614 [Salpingoeca rosetta]|uniref:Rho-GAP domain-containing protein n=1 Tax=Salpingoeca rosetta (strain ATCC 50818 / BSB-021) TaxID=946362 RepID=F2U2T4_SALR5|nr:uncharacterized protein PTSG_02614 [Salpingoeca rosetta]EGD81928.1 hypothetical protein PTSG_02614 [Salpingoeca rosetta]|eukprot:XP_004996111.1 hypothetical protein PTSG_02614 [Salpingoeca rosetta]
MSDMKPSAMRSARSATVSSANPLRHRNPHITETIRERFNALDLEVLLHEFRAVADSQGDEEEEAPSEVAADPESEAKWLSETGFDSLAQKFESGKHITDADIEAQMAGFSAQQKRAVKARAQLLNETLSMRGIKKPSKPSAKDIFANPPQQEEMRQRLLSTKVDVPTMFYDLSEEDQKQTPEPLLTDAYIEAFSLTQRLKDQVYGLQLLVMLLPKVHRACLRRLLAFLVKVGENADENKMSTRNLAVVFAPTLFYVRGHKGKRMLKEVEIQVTTASTLKLMLENHRKLWEVPADILGQIRFVNESRMSGRKANKPKDLKRLLTERKSGLFSKAPNKPASDVMVRWVSNSTKVPPVEACVSVIGPTGELEPDLEVTRDTTCADILRMMESPPIYDLYECGGNINRRRINPLARILPILRVNPGLTLMILGSS